MPFRPILPFLASWLPYRTHPIRQSVRFTFLAFLAGLSLRLGVLAVLSVTLYNRTGIPRPARYSFICRIVNVPKWAIDATSTASAWASVIAS